MSIHKLADIHPDAKIGVGCTVGAFTSIGPGVRIGDGSEIGTHCDLGVRTSQVHGRVKETSDKLFIGEDSIIRGHSTFYLGSSFGQGLNTGHYVSVREGVSAGPGLQLGSFADLQGHATIGRYVRIFNGAHICQWSTIGNYVWIFPYVVLTNDPTPPSDVVHVGPIVEDFAVVATRVTLLPGVRIGRDSLVGANSLVTMDVSPGDFVVGSPAKRVGSARLLQLRDKSGPAYPWRRHFSRGFPAGEVNNWPTLD